MTGRGRPTSSAWTGFVEVDDGEKKMKCLGCDKLVSKRAHRMNKHLEKCPRTRSRQSSVAGSPRPGISFDDVDDVVMEEQAPAEAEEQSNLEPENTRGYRPSKDHHRYSPR